MQIGISCPTTAKELHRDSITLKYKIQYNKADVNSYPTSYNCPICSRTFSITSFPNLKHPQAIEDYKVEKTSMYFGLLVSIIGIAIISLQFSGFLRSENSAITDGLAFLFAGCVLVGPFLIIKSILDLSNIRKTFYIQMTDETGAIDGYLGGHGVISLDGSKLRKVTR